MADPLPLTQLCSKIKIVECCVIRHSMSGSFQSILLARSSDHLKMAVGSGHATHQRLLLQLSLLPDHWVTSSSQGPISRLAAAQISPTDTKTPLPFRSTRPCRRWRALAAGETGAARCAHTVSPGLVNLATQHASELRDHRSPPQLECRQKPLRAC